MSNINIEAVKNEVFDLVQKAGLNKPISFENQNMEFNKSIADLVEIRAKLINEFSPVLNLLETIENQIKELNPEKGEYGFNRKLKITEMRSKIVDEPKVYNILTNMGEDPLNYFKLKVSDKLISALLDKNKDLYQLSDNPTKRYAYSSK